MPYRAAARLIVSSRLLLLLLRPFLLLLGLRVRVLGVARLRGRGPVRRPPVACVPFPVVGRGRRRRGAVHPGASAQAERAPRAHVPIAVPFAVPYVVPFCRAVLSCGAGGVADRPLSQAAAPTAALDRCETSPSRRSPSVFMAPGRLGAASGAGRVTAHAAHARCAADAVAVAAPHGARTLRNRFLFPGR